MKTDSSLLIASRLNTLNSVQLQLLALKDIPEQTLQDIQATSDGINQAVSETRQGIRSIASDINDVRIDEYTPSSLSD